MHACMHVMYVFFVFLPCLNLGETFFTLELRGMGMIGLKPIFSSGCGFKTLDPKSKCHAKILSRQERFD